MKIKEAKAYFEAGVITRFDVVPAPMCEGWLLVAHGVKKTWTLETALSQPKVFLKLDTIVGEISAITGRGVKMLGVTV